MRATVLLLLKKEKKDTEKRDIKRKREKENTKREIYENEKRRTKWKKIKK